MYVLGSSQARTREGFNKDANTKMRTYVGPLAGNKGMCSGGFLPKEGQNALRRALLRRLESQVRTQGRVHAYMRASERIMRSTRRAPRPCLMI